MLHGAELAAAYLNEQGGVQTGDLAGATFEIEGVDDQESTEAATTIAARVIDDPSIFALTGFITSAQAQAAGTVLDSAGMGMVVSFAAADFLTDQADNLALVLTAVSNTGLVGGAFVTEELGATSVGSIAGDYSFLDSYYAGLDEGLEAGGASNVSKQTYTEGTTDFSTLLTSIESSSPDVVMSGAFQSDAGKIASQMRGMGMDQPFVDFLGEGWGESFGAAAGSALNTGDFYQLDPMDAFPADGSLAAEISEQFRTEYGKTMPAAAAHTFDSVLTIAAAIEAGATEREQLIEYIPQVEGEGLLGPIAFNSDLRPEERIVTISRVTGPEPSDRELVKYYSAFGDGTVAGK
ncbi:branched-chain amino acid ABC transporter substrate-binding protein [Leucobacter rhizosphaerae]|uniref:Branched-chain amino acid ABC transporter substrate-binding protein n=2 Tax=Leucobacter rhizosphaerae TaxID=2932245 RepID=A0ABY4FU55_9MICO|nr:branched-chain amino acid ABC transporter substrate-binding protein [Leucobacter rhizosphaerae]